MSKHISSTPASDHGNLIVQESTFIVQKFSDVQCYRLFIVVYIMGSHLVVSHFSLNLSQKNQSGNEISNIFDLPLADELLSYSLYIL